jgi:PadR family transcriptional regulator PadR
MTKEKSDLIYGTLDMLILRALQHEPRHGAGHCGIASTWSRPTSSASSRGRSIRRCTGLRRRALIRAEWGVSEKNRKARFYELTTAGRKRLASEIEHWERMAAAVRVVLSKA